MEIRRRDKVDKIRRDYARARKKGLEHDESWVFALEQNRDCTAWEIASGIYPLHALSLKTDSAEKQKILFGEVLFRGAKDMFRTDKHKIAKNEDKWKNYRIITVWKEIKQIDGRIRKIPVQTFAVGEDALNAIPARKRVIKGILKEIEDYESKGTDPTLAGKLATDKRRRQKIVGVE